MTALDHKRKPTFLWQGLLILLPVIVMAVIGWLAIKRDRAAVEQEAQQRAKEILQQLMPDLSRRVAMQLAQYDAFSDYWTKQRLVWMQSPTAEVTPGQGDILFEQWLHANRGSEPEAVLPSGLWFARDRRLVWPRDYDEAPCPPGWLLALSGRQRLAWEKLERAEAAGDNPVMEGAAEKFLALNPPAEARAVAEFIQLKAGLAEQAPEEASQRLARFAWEHPGVPGNSGLPLSSLAVAEGLRLARANPRRDQVLAARTKPPFTLAVFLAALLETPSLLTSELLDQAGLLVVDHSIDNTLIFNFCRQPLAQARRLWSGQQRLHALAEAVRETGKLGSDHPTHLWLDHAHQRWFCRLNLSSSNSGTNIPPADHTNQLILARVYPKVVVERAFSKMIRAQGLSIPDYLGLTLELEQESLDFRSDFSGLMWDSGMTTHINLAVPPLRMADPRLSRVLAEARDHLAVPEGGLVSETLPRQSAGSALEPGAQAEGAAFTLRIHLANPELLFARQRQRTFLFGGVILASLLAALVGLSAAYRSFHRQLRLNELKSNFVSSVSHELRAPIASVRLMTESLERGKISEPSKQQEYFRFIGQECRRLSSLIANVLDFSRIEQGRKQYEFEPTDLLALTRQTVKLMETYAAERQVALTMAVPAPQSSPDQQLSTVSYQLNVDGKALQQALINLIDNAVKHSAKGQTVTVGLETSNDPSPELPTPYHASRITHCGSRLLLWVEDQGEGIPPQEQEKIFERFYRLGSELRRETQGVGIGLSIVKHVVEAHNGRVLVRSAFGRGSRFTIELPISASNSNSETRNAKPE